MIDTEQFDGHTPGPWVHYTMGADEPYHSVHADGWETWGIQTPTTHGADARLIAAAPDLLAEVKRLRRLLQAVLDNADEADLDNEVYLDSEIINRIKEMIE